MKILVDADACPVKEGIRRLAADRGIPVVLVADTSHEIDGRYGQVITVDRARESADIKIANLALPGDIVVTQDYGVAAMALGKGARAIGPGGLTYDSGNIDRLLFERHLGQKVRRTGQRTRGVKKRTAQDDAAFEAALAGLLEAAGCPGPVPAEGGEPPGGILEKGDPFMLSKQWKQLKSGTDIRGVATEAPGQPPVNLTGPVAARLAFGFLKWLRKQNPGKDAFCVAVGHDSRLSGPPLRDAVAGALSQAGCRVLDCGLSSTPAMFMTTVRLGCDGAVQITASHHPYFRNGLKFFCEKGGLDSPDITAILEYAQQGAVFESIRPGTVEKVDFMRDYAAGLRQMIREGVDPAAEKPLNGYHIVVDAGNGAGGFFARDVLEPLGADIAGSRYLEPDGRFPNHIPNPEDETAMASVREATVQSHADLGVIFDTDVDRAGCVDAEGNEINRNRLVALAAAIVLEENPGATVVTDSITSSGLHDFLEKTLGGRHVRYKRGYKNVINMALSLNGQGVDAPLAMETSGHAALRENFFLDDGAYLMTKIIVKMAQLGRKGGRLEDLTAALRQPEEEKEFRFSVKGENFVEYGEGVIRDLAEHAAQSGWQIAPDNYEGVRVSFGPGEGDGWFLLRMSVHDPVMPLNIESDVQGGVRIIAQKLYNFFTRCKRLEISPLESFLK